MRKYYTESPQELSRQCIEANERHMTVQLMVQLMVVLMRLDLYVYT